MSEHLADYSWSARNKIFSVLLKCIRTVENAMSKSEPADLDLLKINRMLAGVDYIVGLDVHEKREVPHRCHERAIVPFVDGSLDALLCTVTHLNESR